MVIRDYTYYLENLKEEFPDLSEAILEKIVLKGLKNMQHLVRADHDVKIANNCAYRKYSLTIINPMSDWQKLMDRAKSRYFQLLRRREKYAAK